jgi:hypothetical protein
MERHEVKMGERDEVTKLLGEKDQSDFGKMILRPMANKYRINL